ncbi:hypothetical protein KCU81_g738, partial [Aureobasidium melanogenum]
MPQVQGWGNGTLRLAPSLAGLEDISEKSFLSHQASLMEKSICTRPSLVNCSSAFRYVRDIIWQAKKDGNAESCRVSRFIHC